MDEKRDKKKTFSVSKRNKKEQRKEKFKKFIGSKSEGQGFADKRKRKIQYEYKKMLQKERRMEAGRQMDTKRQTLKTDGQTDTDGETSKGKKFRRNDVHIKGQSVFSKAAEQSKLKKEKKRQKKEEALKNKKERDAAMAAYQGKKKATFKKICKRTSKGQPVMKNQMEYLLQKIEKQVNQT